MPTNKTTSQQNNRTTSEQHRSQSNRTTSQSRGPSIKEATRPAAELFDHAMNSYEKAFRTGLRLQEESGKWWTTLLEQTGPSRDWQKTMRTMAAELLPEAQKRMEDGLRMVEQNSRASLEVLKFFKKAIEVPQTNPVAESQSQLLNFWEASLNSMRDSAQAVAQANTQALESWMELFRAGTQMAAERSRI